MSVTQEHNKYGRRPVMALTGRQWPDQVISQAPAWISTDLSHGLPALQEDMSATQKRDYLSMLSRIHCRTVMVNSPVSGPASDRLLLEEIKADDELKHIRFCVPSTADEQQIRETMAFMAGFPAVTLVFDCVADDYMGQQWQGAMEQATQAAACFRRLSGEFPQTGWQMLLNVCPYDFSRLDAVRDLCDAVQECWQGENQQTLQVCLTCMTEILSPHQFADQVEWLHRNLRNRDSVSLAVATGNDRGGAVTAAEMALLAGADVICGTITGLGGRCGSADLITVALNLKSQGVEPGLKLDDMGSLRRTFTRLTQRPVEQQHPYIGEQAFQVQSARQQPVIRRAMQDYEPGQRWQVPFLHIDPRDIGVRYQQVMRVSGRSGSAGISYVMESRYGIQLPAAMLDEFCHYIADTCGDPVAEISPTYLWVMFQNAYLNGRTYLYQRHRLWTDEDGETHIVLQLQKNGQELVLEGQGNGPIDACMNALNVPGVHLCSYHEQAKTAGAGAEAACFVSLAEGEGQPVFGAGCDVNTNTASIRSVISALNRL